MTRRLLKLFYAAALLSAVAVTMADPDKNESGKGPEREWHSSGTDDAKKGKEWRDDRHEDKSWHRERHGRGSYFHQHGYTHLQIPPGHYPPPGECRIWYPDRPPGHQPPPGQCWPVPPGAWMIRHPPAYPNHVHVHVYDQHRPGRVLVVGEFEISSGTFIRIVLDK